MMNKKLAKERNIDSDTQFAIENLQQRISQYCKRPELYFSSPVEAVKVIESYEFVLQTLWGFKPDPSYHTYWYNLSGCTCPKFDNKELMGYHLSYLNGDCPFHSLKLDHWN